MKTVALGLFTARLPVSNRQRETETRSAFRPILRPESSLVRFNDGLRHRQTHAHPVGLGGEKRFKQSCERFAGYPRTVVGDPDFDGGGIRPVSAHLDARLVRVRIHPARPWH